MSNGFAISPVSPGALETARRAFLGVRDGAATGDWSGFYALLGEDATAMVSPTAAADGPEGLLVGRDDVVATLSAYHANLAGGVDIQVKHLAADGDVVTVECRAEGPLAGKGSANHYLLAFGTRDGALTSFTQYATWSDTGPASGWRREDFARDAFATSLNADEPGFGAPADALGVVDEGVFAVARNAFLGLQRGAATGDWSRFVDQLDNEARIIIPVPADEPNAPEGLICGKEAISRIFGSHHAEINDGATLEARRVTVDGKRVVMECRVEGRLNGEEVSNFLVFVFEVTGRQVSSMYEYATWTAKRAGSRWTEPDFARDALPQTVIPLEPGLIAHA